MHVICVYVVSKDVSLSINELLIVTVHVRGISRVKITMYSGETPDNYIILEQHYIHANSISTYGVYIPASWFSARVTHRAVRITYADARIRLVGICSSGYILSAKAISKARLFEM